MISVFHLDPEGRLKTGLDAGELKALVREPRGTVWVDLEAPTDDETALLGEVFAFHPLAVEDCREATAYPKLDDFGEYLFLVMLAPDLVSVEQEDPAMLDLAAFLGGHYVVTYHTRPLRSIRDLKNRVERSPKDVMGRGAAYLLHATLDALVNQYDAVVQRLDETAERLQDQILEEPRKEMLDRVLALRSHVLQLRRILADERNLMAELSRGRGPLVADEVQIYFSDLYDHLDELGDKLDVSRDALGGARDLYLSVAAHRTNETMRVLAVIATILLPLMFVTGVYGMNITLPLAKSPQSFWILSGIMVAIAAGFYGYFRWKKWV